MFVGLSGDIVKVRVRGSDGDIVTEGRSGLTLRLIVLTFDLLILPDTAAEMLSTLTLALTLNVR